MKIAINGFGRIGKLVFRAFLEKNLKGDKSLIDVRKYINFTNFIGMSSFGASGPYKEVYKHFGITSDDICKKVKLQLNL